MVVVAAIALTATLKKAIDIASSAALAEGSLLFWLNEDIDWIVREMRNLQSYLKRADAMQQDGTQDVANFILNIRDLANDVEDILDTFLPQMESHRRQNGFLGCLRTSACLFCSCYTANCFSLEIQKIRKRVNDIDRVRKAYGIPDSGIIEKKEKDNAGSTAVEIDPWDPRRPILHLDEPNLVGFDERIGVLKAKLLNLASECESIKFDQPSTSNPHVGEFGQGDAEIVLQDPLPTIGYDVISIVGMPGLGKTTLAKEVYKIAVAHNDDGQLKYFNCSALVYVSQEPNINQILLDIASQVGLEEERRKENLVANLYRFLSGKRYVIMFDDIWQTETWDALKKSIPVVSKNGSRLIITSRNSDVGRYIGRESSLHELKPLEPKDSWELFSKMVLDIPQHTDEPRVRQELKVVGRQIVERCSGLPLAIVVTAGLLLSKERTERAWTEVLESMGQYQVDGYSKILALSYKDLDIELKPCFLYFGIYPQNYEISTFQLINLWVAEKLIRASGNQTIEVVGENYLHKLVSRNLIQVVRRRFDGRIRSCRIHDLLHVLCNEVAKDSNFFCTGSNLTPDYATRLRRVTTHRTSINEYISLNHQTPKLRSFLCFNKDGTPEPERLNFLVKDFKFLCVLRVWCRNNHFPVPHEIGSLIHMSYLQLSGILEVTLPATIRNLKNLLIMDLQGCQILHLPTIIWEMKQLKHILLPRVVILYTPLLRRRGSEVEVSLPNLQTFIGCDDWFHAEWLENFQSLRTLKIGSHFDNYEFLFKIIKVLSGGASLLDKLENLRIRFLDISEMRDKFYLSGYQNLFKLHINGPIMNLPTDLLTFPPNLTKLTLKNTHLDEDSMVTLEKLPKLIHLKCDAYSYVKKRMVCSGADNFCQLEVLQIRELYDLEELIVDQRGMPRLKKLIITRCPNLKMLSPRLGDIMTYE